MSFQGVATLSASTAGTPGPLTTGSVSSPGPRGDFFGTYFDVSSPVTAVLSLHAQVDGNGAFALYLSDLSNGSFVPVFFQSASDGSPIPQHDVTLALGAGTYELRAELSGIAALNQRGSFSAGFALQAITSPIPEAQAWAMLLAGMPLLAGVATRLRRRGIRAARWRDHALSAIPTSFQHQVIAARDAQMHDGPTGLVLRVCQGVGCGAGRSGIDVLEFAAGVRDDVRGVRRREGKVRPFDACPAGLAPLRRAEAVATEIPRGRTQVESVGAV
jgi:hypothetical protein